MALPVVHQTGERLLLVVAEMEPVAEMPRLDGLLRFSIAERFRDRHLPRREHGLAVHGLVVGEDGIPFLRVRETGPESRLFRCLLVDVDEDVLQVRLLAPDTIHADAAGDVPDQPETRPCLHRLLLAGVAREHHLGPVALGELEDVVGLAGRQHPRLVHHDQGLGANLHLLLGGQLEKLVDAVGTCVAVIPQRHRRPPSDGCGNDLVAVLLVKVCDGPERGGLARPRRALDHSHPAAPGGGMADGQRLLLAQRITVSQEGLHLLLHRLFRQAVAGIGRHGCRHVLDRLLQAQVVAGGIDLGVGHARQ